MAYKIDFTAADYVKRSRRKLFLRLLLLAALGAAAWGVYDVYKTYNEPTLDMRLTEYEAVAHPIEAMNRMWDESEKEFNTILPYYRLVWADSPTNFLNAMASDYSPRLGRGFRPVRWTLKTGGGCKLDYIYVFNAGDKAQQAREIEDKVVNSVTSVVKIATNTTVAVQGVMLENLLNVEELVISAKFSLPGVRGFPPKEKKLAESAAEIVAMRKRVQDLNVPDAGATAGSSQKALAMMMAYIDARFKEKPGFPATTNAINVAGWFDKADRFVKDNGIPVNASETARLKNAWKKFGSARFPWDRHRELDNAALTARVAELGKVSDGVKKFKEFLGRRHEKYVKWLEPLVNAHNRNDVFNRPIVELDLKHGAAKGANLAAFASVSFKDAEGVSSAELAKEEETFTFSWVRWTLSLGIDTKRNGESDEEVAAADPEALSLKNVADCICRVVNLGPGYALDSVRIDFDANGKVSSAVLEGLLPVKKAVPNATAKKPDGAKDGAKGADGAKD